MFILITIFKLNFQITWARKIFNDNIGFNIGYWFYIQPFYPLQ